MIPDDSPVMVLWSDEDLVGRTTLVVHGAPVESRTDHEMFLAVDSPHINTMFTNHCEALFWWLDQESPD